MKIGIDIRTLMVPEHSGVPWYTRNLLAHLFELDRKNEYVLFYNSAKPVAVPEFDFPNVSTVYTRVPNKLLSFCLRYLKLPKLDRLMGEVDVLFLPTWHFAAWSRHVPAVLTGHDLSFERHPECFTPYGRFWHRHLMNQRWLARRADRIVANSEFTRRELIDEYGVDPRKIEAAPLAANASYRPVADAAELDRVRQKYDLPEGYLFTLGTQEPRKNLRGLLEAYALYRGRVANPGQLVVAGGRGWLNGDIPELIESLGIAEHVRFLGYVDEADKPALYTLAGAFAFPSLYEGFGLPPLEAMACGAPVVCSDATSLPEVVGDAAVTVDPYDVEGMARALAEVSTDDGLRAQLREAGPRQAAKFSWEETARRTLHLIEQAYADRH